MIPVGQFSSFGSWTNSLVMLPIFVVNLSYIPLLVFLFGFIQIASTVSIFDDIVVVLFLLIKTEISKV